MDKLSGHDKHRHTCTKYCLLKSLASWPCENLELSISVAEDQDHGVPQLQCAVSCRLCAWVEDTLKNLFFAKPRATNEVWVLLPSEGLSLLQGHELWLCAGMLCALREYGSQHVSSAKAENCRATVWSNEAVSFYIGRKLAPLSFSFKYIILVLTSAQNEVW